MATLIAKRARVLALWKLLKSRQIRILATHTLWECGLLRQGRVICVV
jgi:hypothetical protein